MTEFLSYFDSFHSIVHGRRVILRIRAEPLSSALLDIVASSNSSLDQFRDTLLRLRELDDPEARRSEDGGSGAVDDGPTTLSSQTHALPAVRE